MSASSAVAAGQMAAESRMSDTCRITGPGVGDPVFNETTGQYEGPAPTTVYEGACRIPRRDTGTTVSDASAGEATWKVGEFPLALPMSSAAAAGVEVGMTVTYLSSANDPSLVGRVFGVTGVSRQTDSTARRFRMMEVQG